MSMAFGLPIWVGAASSSLQRLECGTPTKTRLAGSTPLIVLEIVIVIVIITMIVIIIVIVITIIVIVMMIVIDHFSNAFRSLGFFARKVVKSVAPVLAS